MTDVPNQIWVTAPYIGEYYCEPPVNAEDMRFLTEYIPKVLSEAHAQAACDGALMEAKQALLILRKEYSDDDAVEGCAALDEADAIIAALIGTPAPGPTGVHCHDCKREYGEPGFPDLIIPHDVWNTISPTGDEGGLLCPSCLCARLEHAGIETTGMFTSGPLNHRNAPTPAPSFPECIHLTAQMALECQTCNPGFETPHEAPASTPAEAANNILAQGYDPRRVQAAMIPFLKTGTRTCEAFDAALRAIAGGE